MILNNIIFFKIIDEHEKVTGKLKYCCQKINEMQQGGELTYLNM